jgi:hypothetical protein
VAVTGAQKRTQAKELGKKSTDLLPAYLVAVAVAICQMYVLRRFFFFCGVCQSQGQAAGGLAAGGALRVVLCSAVMYNA